LAGSYRNSPFFAERKAFPATGSAPPRPCLSPSPPFAQGIKFSTVAFPETPLSVDRISCPLFSPPFQGPTRSRSRPQFFSADSCGEPFPEGGEVLFPPRDPQAERAFALNLPPGRGKSPPGPPTSPPLFSPCPTFFPSGPALLLLPLRPPPPVYCFLPSSLAPPPALFRTLLSSWPVLFGSFYSPPSSPFFRFFLFPFR